MSARRTRPYGTPLKGETAISNYPELNSAAAIADALFMHLHVPDRRRGYRRQASAMAILRPVNQPDNEPGKTLDAHVFDLSVYGVGMSVREAIEVGTVFDFAMCDGRQSGKRIEIKSCRLRPDNMFDVGGQFC